jgi:hypothetical protein
MLENQIDQWERRETLRNDLKVRQQQEERHQRVFAPDQSLPKQATTFQQFAQADADTPRGRFSAIDASYVVGSKSDVSDAYPAASAAHQIQLPDEPPLGLDNPTLEEPSTVLLSSPGEATGPTSDDPSPLGRGVGSFSSDDPTTEGLAPPSVTPRAQRGGVGSSPFRRRV